LVELDKDIIGLPTPIWQFKGDLTKFPIKKAVYDENLKEYYPQEGLQQVYSIGTGCFLLSKRVAEKVKEYPFMRVYNRDGTVSKGNDLAFCDRVREAGFEIWAHFDYTCSHFKEIDVDEIEQVFKQHLIPNRKE